MKVYGAWARAEALAAGDPDWMGVTEWDVRDEVLAAGSGGEEGP